MSHKKHFSSTKKKLAIISTWINLSFIIFNLVKNFFLKNASSRQIRKKNSHVYLFIFSPEILQTFIFFLHNIHGAHVPVSFTCLIKFTPSQNHKSKEIKYEKFLWNDIFSVSASSAVLWVLMRQKKKKCASLEFFLGNASFNLRKFENINIFFWVLRKNEIIKKN